MKGNVRNVKGEPFVSVPQQTAKDPTLTNAQLGFLTRLLCKPEEWEYRPRQIAEEFELSLSTTHRLFDALAGKGYIVRHDVRTQDSKGGWTRTCEYKVYASLKLRIEDDEVSVHKILPFPRARGVVPSVKNDVR